MYGSCGDIDGDVCRIMNDCSGNSTLSLASGAPKRQDERMDVRSRPDPAGLQRVKVWETGSQKGSEECYAQMLIVSARARLGRRLALPAFAGFTLIPSSPMNAVSSCYINNLACLKMFCAFTVLQSHRIPPRNCLVGRRSDLDVAKHVQLFPLTSELTRRRFC